MTNPVVVDRGTRGKVQYGSNSPDGNTRGNLYAQDGIGTLWVKNDSAGTWKRASGTLDDAYRRYVAGANVNVDEKDLKLNPSGDYSVVFDLSGVSNTDTDGVLIENGSDYFRFRRAGTNELSIASETKVIDFNTSSTFDIDSVGNITVDSDLYISVEGAKVSIDSDHWYFGGGLAVVTIQATSTSGYISVGGGAAATAIKANPGDTTFNNGTVEFQGTCVSVDDSVFYFGTGGDASISYNTTQTPDALVLGLGSDSRGLIICENGDIGTDFGHAQETNPTLFVHSADASDTTDWISFAHDQTDGVISTGKGHLKLMGATSTQIGDAGSPGEATGQDDLFVSGKLEVDGWSYFEGFGNFEGGLRIGGSVNTHAIFYENDTYDQLLLALGTNAGGQFILMDPDSLSRDFDHDPQANPTMFIHSATDPNSDNTEWISFVHDQTDGVISTGKGAVAVYPFLDQDENLNNFRELKLKAENSSFGLRVMEITIAHDASAFDAAALTDSASVWTQPADSILFACKVRLDEQFAASGMTDLDITIGDAGDNSGILDPGSINLTSDAVGTEYKDRGGEWSTATEAGYYASANTTWTLYSSATGADLDTTTAGQITVYFIYLRV